MTVGNILQNEMDWKIFPTEKLLRLFLEIAPVVLPGDDRTGARKRPQNDPWGMVNSAHKKSFYF
jgi:hypothetical protein